MRKNLIWTICGLLLVAVSGNPTASGTSQIIASQVETKNTKDSKTNGSKDTTDEPAEADVISYQMTDFQSASGDWFASNVGISQETPGAAQLLRAGQGQKVQRSVAWLYRPFTLDDSTIYEVRLSYRVYQCQKPLVQSASPSSTCSATVALGLQSLDPKLPARPMVQNDPVRAFGLLPNNKLGIALISTEIDGGKLSTGFLLPGKERETFSGVDLEVGDFDSSRVVEALFYVSLKRCTSQLRLEGDPWWSPAKAVLERDMSLSLLNKTDPVWLGVLAQSGSPKSGPASSVDLLSFTVKSYHAEVTPSFTTRFETLSAFNQFGELKTSKHGLVLLDRSWKFPRQNSAGLWFKQPFRLADRIVTIFETQVLLEAFQPSGVKYGSGFAFVLNPASPNAPPGDMLGSYGACYTEHHYGGKSRAVLFVDVNIARSLIEIASCDKDRDKVVRAQLPISPGDLRPTDPLQLRVIVRSAQLGVQYRRVPPRSQAGPWSETAWYRQSPRRALGWASTTWAGFTSYGNGEEQLTDRPRIILQNWNVTIYEDVCDPDPCTGRGECVIVQKQPKCECHEGYAGKDCSLEDPRFFQDQVAALKSELYNMRVKLNSHAADTQLEVERINMQRDNTLTQIGAALQQAMVNARTEAESQILRLREQEQQKLLRQRKGYDDELETVQAKYKAQIAEAEDNKNKMIERMQAQIERLKAQREQARTEAEQTRARLQQQLDEVLAKVAPLRDQYQQEIEQVELQASSREDSLILRLRDQESRLQLEIERITLEREKFENEASRRRGQIERQASTLVKAAKAAARKEASKLQMEGDRLVAQASALADRAQQQMQSDETARNAAIREKDRAQKAILEAQQMQKVFENHVAARLTEFDTRLSAARAKVENVRAGLAKELQQVKAATQEKVAAIEQKEVEIERQLQSHEVEIGAQQKEAERLLEAKEASLKEQIDMARRTENKARDEALQEEERLRSDLQNHAEELRSQIRAADATAEATLDMARAFADRATAVTEASEYLALHHLLEPDAYPTRDPHMVPLPKNYALLPSEELASVKLAQAVSTERELHDVEKQLFTEPTEAPTVVPTLVAPAEEPEVAKKDDPEYAGSQYIGMSPEQIASDPMKVLEQGLDQQVTPTLMPEPQSVVANPAETANLENIANDMSKQISAEANEFVPSENSATPSSQPASDDDQLLTISSVPQVSAE